MALFVILAVFLGSNIVAGMAAMGVASALGTEIGDVTKLNEPSHVFVFLGVELALIAGVFIAAWYLGVTRQQLSIAGGSWKRSLLLTCPLLVFAFLPLVAATIDSSQAQHATLKMAGLFVVLSITIGCAEELLFRGLVIPLLGGRADRLFAVIASSVLFGLVHILPFWGKPIEEYYNALQVMLAFGIPFACIVLVTKSLVGPIVFHALNDAVALSLIGGRELPSIPPAEMFTGLVITSIIAGSYLLWFRKTVRPAAL